MDATALKFDERTQQSAELVVPDQFTSQCLATLSTCLDIMGCPIQDKIENIDTCIHTGKG